MKWLGKMSRAWRAEMNAADRVRVVLAWGFIFGAVSHVGWVIWHGDFWYHGPGPGWAPWFWYGICLVDFAVFWLLLTRPRVGIIGALGDDDPDAYRQLDAVPDLRVRVQLCADRADGVRSDRAGDCRVAVDVVAVEAQPDVFSTYRRLSGCTGRAFHGNSVEKAASCEAEAVCGSAITVQRTVSEQGGVVSEPS